MSCSCADARTFSPWHRWLENDICQQFRKTETSVWQAPKRTRSLSLPVIGAVQQGARGGDSWRDGSAKPSKPGRRVPAGVCTGAGPMQEELLTSASGLRTWHRVRCSLLLCPAMGRQTIMSSGGLSVTSPGPRKETTAMSTPFTALVIDDVDGSARASLKPLTLAELPDDEVLVEVAFSALNYKDGLAVCGNRNKVARKLPMVGGIDLAGTVLESRSPRWRSGDKVVLNGFGLSETHWGGYTRYQRVKPEWLLRLPQAFSHAAGLQSGASDGHRHGGLYRRIVCRCPGGLGPAAGAGRGAGHGRCRRRGIGGHRAAGQGGLRGNGLDRPARDARILARPGREPVRGSGKPATKGRAAAKGALGLRGGCRRQQYAGQRAGADPLWRGGGGLRPGRRHGTQRHGIAAHPARRGLAGRRFRDGADGQARACVAAPRARSRCGEAGADEHGRADVKNRRAGRGHPGGQDARARGHRCDALRA
ncbi:hypothetical protein SBBP2_740010 [Burkholderiales bacterium]|nr:hypothetical protein SBBP2_740010 [Burkholderiales bacterium]